MTDRVKGFTVTLSQDIREDDFEDLMKAFKMMKYVAHIEPEIVTGENHMERERVKFELREKFSEFYRETFTNY